VFADGPRSQEEARRCELALAETKAVDWDCDVRWDVAGENLGARRRYSSGVDWVFSDVDEAIVLDDDCVPDPTFFGFCEELLACYRDDPRVMMVCGTNYLDRWQDDRQSYHFSCYGGVWGWATWKRAWRHNDMTLSGWGDERVRARVREFIADDEQYAIQARRFDRLYADATDRHSWDLPWSLARLSHEGRTVARATARRSPPTEPAGHRPALIRPMSKRGGVEHFFVGHPATPRRGETSIAWRGTLRNSRPVGGANTDSGLRAIGFEDGSFTYSELERCPFPGSQAGESC
jgi:hypothetical protein